MLSGLLALLAVSVGSLGVASLLNARKGASFGQSDSTLARAAAEEGLDQIVATLNQPENRKLLVSGTAMNSWASASGTTLQSPCVRGDGTRPGSNNDGQPSTVARNYGDGQFRDVDSGTVNSGERRFALQSVTYAAGASGAADRRSLTTTTTAGSSTLTTTGSYPSGTTHDRLVNLEDPDGSGALLPGSNSGFVTLTARGQVVRGGRVIASATVTRELQVLPKCCGASFGSNGSGGVGVGTGSLGADSRFCGVQFGIIVGINGGTMWTFYANDRYTTRNASSQVVNINSMLGVLNSGQTQFQRSNCRVLPTPATGCGQSSLDTSYGNTLRTASPGGLYGTANDIAGTSISGIPLVPITIAALPSIATRYAFPWTAGGGPADRIAQASNAGYVTLTTSGTTSRITIRSRSDTSPPRVELCTSTTASPCTDTSWTPISGQITTATAITIADSLPTTSYTGSTGSRALWLGAWTENDWPAATGGSANPQSPTAGNVQVVTASSNQRIRLGDASNAAATVARRSHIQRALNLAGLTNTSLSYTFDRQQLENNDTGVLEVSTNGGSSWNTIDSFNGSTATGVRTISAATFQPYVSANTLIRFRLTSDFANNEFVFIDDVTVNATETALADSGWCQYSASSPVTAAPGFHCLGPQMNLTAGGSVIIDTTGGPISFYYNQPTDTRGSTQTVSPFTTASPLIATDNGATIQHVRCTALNNNCLTPIPESEYAPVGEPDRLNFFDRDSGATQFLNVGSLANSSSSPGKIAGVWFYFPVGNLTLTVDGCADGSQPSNFYTNDNGWNFSGRIWVKDLKPCGAFHFRVPPSDVADTSTLFGSTTLAGLPKSILKSCHAVAQHLRAPASP